jgi:hypothetical protein
MFDAHGPDGFFEEKTGEGRKKGNPPPFFIPPVTLIRGSREESVLLRGTFDLRALGGDGTLRTLDLLELVGFTLAPSGISFGPADFSSLLDLNLRYAGETGEYPFHSDIE